MESTYIKAKGSFFVRKFDAANNNVPNHYPRTVRRSEIGGEGPYSTLVAPGVDIGLSDLSKTGGGVSKCPRCPPLATGLYPEQKI